MKEPMSTHLAKRGSTYYYRRKTPIELVPFFGKEVMKSLGTKDRKLAEALVRQIGTTYDMLFSAASANLVLDGNVPISNPSTKDIQEKAYEFTDGLTVNDSELYAIRFLQRLRASRERAVAEGNFNGFKAALNNLIGDAKQFLKTGEHPFENNPKPMWRVEAELLAARALKKNEPLPFQLGVSTDSVGDASKSASNHTLSKLVDKWAAERAPRPKSIAKMRRVVHKFEEAVGVLAITQITKKHTVDFKDSMLESGSSPANVNQYLTELNTLLNFASHQAIIETNPASGVRVKVNESAKTKRQPFDLPALNAIFSSPVYAQGERPLGGKGEAAYWLPLLALYTGARIEELCQLDVSDVYQENYLDANESSVSSWVIRITDDGEGQKLKNSGSRRRIPVHKVLLDLGFIEYIKGIKTGSIFPELSPAKGYGTMSANWSKWFGNYLRKTIKVTDSRMVFHSFRHCFKDYARAAGIPSEVHNALTGHSSGDVASIYGSDKYPLRPLVEAMKSYKVTGLNLPKSPTYK